MLVMKFGGSSIADEAGIRRVVDIVGSRLDRQPLVVVSAHGGVTDELLLQAHQAVAGQYDLAPLQERHRRIAAALGVELPEHAELFCELADLLRGISFVGELTPRLVDWVSSFGERLSVYTVAAALRKAGVKAEPVMAFDAGLVTDSRYGRAHPQPESDGRIQEFFDCHDGLAVVTGFIARDAEGNITTVGRNGSDYTAALFARALQASEIQIWTDVPGVMTADPRLVPGAQPLEKITFDEAAELAYYGAQVLHPSTLVPAIEAQIPVRVLDTRDPSCAGTLIQPEVQRVGPVVRAIVHKRGVSLLNIVTPRMLGHHGFMARIFEACARHEVALDMIATTEVSVSATVDNARHLPALVKDLSEFAEVSIEDQISTVAVVGHGIGESQEVVSRVFRILSEQGIPLRMITMGATRTNVGLVIDVAETQAAVEALHAAMFEGVRAAGASS